MSELTAAVEANDPDRLLRLVDGLCSARDWDDLLVLRRLCYQAAERGKQLWGVSHHIEYRLALEAPGAWAGPMLIPENGAFALGPLPEVAASTHTWEELAPHLPAGPLRVVYAMERVVRGEDLRAVDDSVTAASELPLVLQGWEPSYPRASFRADKAEFPSPQPPTPTGGVTADELDRQRDPETEDALLALTAAWVDGSDGVSSAVIVEGTAEQAIATISGPARAVEISPSEALSWMAWAAASGGAHGTRRGAAAGRFDAWWAAATVAGINDPWPPDPEELGQVLGELRWLWYVPDDVSPGWHLHLAGEEDGFAWAVAATDAVEENSAT